MDSLLTKLTSLAVAVCVLFGGFIWIAVETRRSIQRIQLTLPNWGELLTSSIRVESGGWRGGGELPAAVNGNAVFVFIDCFMACGEHNRPRGVR
jgi:hypothetical protein